jgi:hypothetical protein
MHKRVGYNTVSRMNGMTQIEGVWEYAAEEDAWTQEGRGNRRLRKLPHKELRNDMIWCKYLAAIGLTPGGSSTAHIRLTPDGSSTAHIYTQTVHRIQRTERTQQ